jgi:hypothetical protein
MKFNSKKEIEIEYNDIISEIPEDDSNIKENIPHIELFLKRWNKLLWQYIYISNPRTTTHQDYLRYKTYLNQEGEREAFKDAIIEMVMGALVSDMHLNAYTDKVAKTMPETVQMFLASGRLVNIGRFIGVIPEWDVVL